METQTVATHYNSSYCEEYLHATVGRSVPADGSLLFVMKFIPRLKQNPDDGNNPKQILKSNMYRLPSRNHFPRGLYTRLHSALAGCQATVFLVRKTENRYGFGFPYLYRTPPSRAPKRQRLGIDGGFPRLYYTTYFVFLQTSFKVN